MADNKLLFASLHFHKLLLWVSSLNLQYPFPSNADITGTGSYPLRSTVLSLQTEKKGNKQANKKGHYKFPPGVYLPYICKTKSYLRNSWHENANQHLHVVFKIDFAKEGKHMCQVKKEPSPCRDIETPERRCCEV